MIVSAPHQITGRDHQVSSYHVAEHRPVRSESLQPHTERSSRRGPEPSSVKGEVYVWRYALLVVHARKKDSNSSRPTDINVQVHRDDNSRLILILAVLQLCVT